MNTLLEAHNLMKRYGDRVVVKDIDLIVSPSEVVALIGPNGAGKSTTLEMVLGLRMPDSGKAYLFPPFALPLHPDV
jgi:ABC-2 type transport system ATP-binding protein